MGGRGRSGRGRDGAWTWSAIGNGLRGRGRGSNSKGRGRGRGGGKGGFSEHDTVRHGVMRSDQMLKTKRGSAAKSKGRGKGKDRGKGYGKDDSVHGFYENTVVSQVAQERLLRHTEVARAHDAGVLAIAMTEQGIYTGAAHERKLKRWKPVPKQGGGFDLNPDLEVPLPDSCTCLLFHGGWIFCGLWSGEIKAFSQEGGECSMRGHTRRVTSIVMHQSVLLSGSNDREVRLWQPDAATKAFNCTHTLSDSMPGSISKLHVLGAHLFVGGDTGLHMVNLEKLAVSKILPPTRSVADFLEFQNHLIVAYGDGSLRIFDADGTMKSDVQPLRAGPITCIAGLEVGPRVLCGHSRGQISTIALPGFEFKTQFQAVISSKIECLKCDGQNGIFLLGSRDGTLQLWQAQ